MWRPSSPPARPSAPPPAADCLTVALAALTSRRHLLARRRLAAGLGVLLLVRAFFRPRHWVTPGDACCGHFSQLASDQQPGRPLCGEEPATPSVAAWRAQREGGAGGKSRGSPPSKRITRHHAARGYSIKPSGLRDSGLRRLTPIGFRDHTDGFTPANWWWDGQAAREADGADGGRWLRWVQRLEMARPGRRGVGAAEVEHSGGDSAG